MRKTVFLGASALLLALGVGAASAEPFDPIRSTPGYIQGFNSSYGSSMNEGRAAAEGSSPFFGGSYFGQNDQSGLTSGSIILQQFHESGPAGESHGR